MPCSKDIICLFPNNKPSLKASYLLNVCFIIQTVEITSPSSECLNYVKAHLKLQLSPSLPQFPSSQ